MYLERKVEESKANKQTCLQSLNNISFGFWLAVRANAPPTFPAPLSGQNFAIFFSFFSPVFLLWLRFIYKINKCRDGLSRHVSSDIWAALAI